MGVERNDGNRSVERAEAKAWDLFHTTVTDFQSGLPTSPAPAKEVVRVRRTRAETEANFKEYVSTISPEKRQEHAAALEEEIIGKLFEAQVDDQTQPKFYVGPTALKTLSHMPYFRQALIIGTYVYENTDEELVNTVSVIRGAPAGFTLERMRDYRNETMLHIGFRLGLIRKKNLQTPRPSPR